MPTIILRPGRDRPIRHYHPWVFSGAIAAVQGEPERGDTVEICANDGEWLARGDWSSQSQIRVRLLTWNADEMLDEAFLCRRIERAIVNRQALCVSSAAIAESNAYRLVYAESDGLPGLIVDRYGDFLVVQFLTQGMEMRSERIVAILADRVRPQGIYERSDAEVRDKEGLPPAEGVRWGQSPPKDAIIQCGHMMAEAAGQSLRFYVDLSEGQKTGFYLDQADNRSRVGAYCRGKQALDGFCYTGGFTAFAAANAAEHITAIDSSAGALDLARANLALNQLDIPFEPVVGDVFKQLRAYRQEGRQFDVIILDPPKFAHSQAHIERATRGYKDINMIALQLLRPGGVLATFSCSGLVSSDLFQKILFGAAVDARRDVQILERLSQSPDHPVNLAFPESEYLKGLICRAW